MCRPYCSILITLLFWMWVIFPTGCRTETSPNTFIPPVTVEHPEKRDVTLYEYFTGTVQAVDSVDVRSRVSGYLEQIKFTSGVEINKNDVLFIIDQRPFQAQVDRASANVAQAEAQRSLAHIEYQRNLQIQKEDPGAISQATLDRSLSNVGVQDASVMQAKASLEEAQLNLNYCTITAPMSGRISRNYVSIGNLVTGGAGQATLLTTIVSVDPIYAYFDVDEPSIERFQKLIREGKRPLVNSKKILVELGLAVDEGKYPHKGYIDFINNQYTTETGTLQIRGVFANPKPKFGRRTLGPGQFVQIRIPSASNPEILVKATAVSQDIVGTYVVVIDDAQVARYRYIELGPATDGGMQVVEKGLSTEDWVVISGQHNAHPGSRVVVHYPKEVGSSQPNLQTAPGGNGPPKPSAGPGN